MAISKSEKTAQRLAKREARREAQEEVMEARVRTVVGFGGAYVATQVLPSLAPSMAEFQGTIDLLTGIGGAYFAFTDDGPLGDYATGVALVGGIQTLDNIGQKINEWLAA